MKDSKKRRKSSKRSLRKACPKTQRVPASVVYVIPTLRASSRDVDGFPEPQAIANPLEQMDRNRRQKRAAWTEDDKKTFTHEFLQHGKNFLRISEALVDKTPEDCIQHYYLTKHAMQYKKLKLEAEQKTAVKRKHSENCSANVKAPQKKRRCTSRDK